MTTAAQLSASRIPAVKRTPRSVQTGARPTAYLRDTKSGVLASRGAPLRNHRDDVRRSWQRSAGLAMDLIQNSGRLKGAVDQVLADTVGVGLTLIPQPDLDGLGYDAEERTAWVRLVKKRWRSYWTKARECDMRGKLTGPQMVDIGLRWYIAYGEVTGVFDFFDTPKRQRYGIASGTKLCLVPPPRLVQDTNSFESLYQGVRHDENGRVASYRFETTVRGQKAKQDRAAYDLNGLPLVMHVFDAQDATDVRGISPIAAAFRKHIQAETLDDATLQMATLQTIFAITLTSDAPSVEAFHALEAMGDEGGELGGFSEDYMGYLSASLEAAAESRISVGADPQVSHLGPGEKLGLEGAGVPGQDFLPFSNSLARDMARAIGCTYGGLTMDYTKATYASVRMESSSIWPVALRRRERIAAPICQMSYESWLDEEIGEGRIPFKGGYRAFRANRDRVCAATWQGPPAPTADDLKAAKASSERLRNGTSSLAIETGHLGYDEDELFEQQLKEHLRYTDAGMASPYDNAAQPQVIEVEPVE